MKSRTVAFIAALLVFIVAFLFLVPVVSYSMPAGVYSVGPSYVKYGSITYWALGAGGTWRYISHGAGGYTQGYSVSVVSATASASSTSSISYTSTAATTFLHTTQSLPPNFTVIGKIPYLAITLQNHTFTLTYAVTAYNYTLELSYDQAYSYAVQYTNGTQWLSTSRPCQTGGIGSVPSTSTTYTTTTVITSTAIPCGSPTGEWYPVNGTVISPHMNINASNVQLTIQPTTIPAHTTQDIQIKVSIDMQPGVYAINLGMDIQLPGSSRPIQYLLGYTPLIVQG